MLFPNNIFVGSEYAKRKIKSVEENIRRIAEEMNELSKVAVVQYRSIVDDILNKEFTDKRENARVMDGMLDFCQFDDMLLFKRLCRELYPHHPQLVQDYISYYREMWDNEYATDGGRIKLVKDLFNFGKM